ncbi:capsid completion protein [Escherichia coli]|uniref:Capsid completion protein n=1 Tax=Escherichia coli TaxID=562 RepID=A0A376CQG5_ECOLX|nr:capsid completion protein [Escherichia coli]
MKFVAPEQAPEQAEIIRNTPFWPDVDLSEFRSVMRTDGTVTQPRLKQVALSAISEVNAELYEFRRRQQMLGMPRWQRFRRNSWTAKVSAFSTISTRFTAGHAPCSTNVTRTMTPRRPV